MSVLDYPTQSIGRNNRYTSAGVAVVSSNMKEFVPRGNLIGKRYFRGTHSSSMKSMGILESGLRRGLRFINFFSAIKSHARVG